MSEELEPKKNGRPTAYRAVFCVQARKLCLLGAIDEELADFFDVSVTTIDTWKNKHPKFLGALKEAKCEADSRVVRSLYQRANGYSHPEDKVFNDGGEPLIVPTVKHYPPDTRACEYWLNNRRSSEWRTKHETEYSGEIKVSRIERTIVNPTDSDS